MKGVFRVLAISTLALMLAASCASASDGVWTRLSWPKNKWFKATSKYFEIYTTEGLKGQVELLVKTLDDTAYSASQSMFEYKVKPPIKLYVHPADDPYLYQGSDPGTMILHDERTIHVNGDPILAPIDQAVCSLFLRGSWPEADWWFATGVPTYARSQRRWFKTVYLEDIPTGVKTWSGLSRYGEAAEYGGEEHVAAFLAARSIFNFLHARYGEVATTQFIRTAAAKHRLAEAAEQAFGKSLADLEGEWLASLKSRVKYQLVTDDFSLDAKFFSRVSGTSPKPFATEWIRQSIDQANVVLVVSSRATLPAEDSEYAVLRKLSAEKPNGPAVSWTLVDRQLVFAVLGDDVSQLEEILLNYDFETVIDEHLPR